MTRPSAQGGSAGGVGAVVRVGRTVGVAVEVAVGVRVETHADGEDPEGTCPVLHAAARIPAPTSSAPERPRSSRQIQSSRRFTMLCPCRQLIGTDASRAPSGSARGVGPERGLDEAAGQGYSPLSSLRSAWVYESSAARPRRVRVTDVWDAVPAPVLAV